MVVWNASGIMYYIRKRFVKISGTKCKRPDGRNKLVQHKAYKK